MELLAAENGPNVLQVPIVELVAGIVVFLILLFGLGRLALPNVRRVLDERSDQIEGGLARAQAAQAEAQSLLEQYRAQLGSARDEAAEIRAKAQADRQAIIEQARGEAASAAEQVHARAQAQLEADRQGMRSELVREVGTMAVALAEKIVGETLADDARVSATVDRFVSDLDDLSAGAPEPV
jgi:F-type H+-transporting ATPase subunit b